MAATTGSNRAHGQRDWIIEEGDRELTSRNFHISVLVTRASYILGQWKIARLTREQAVEQLEGAARELADAWDKERTYGQTLSGDQKADATLGTRDAGEPVRGTE